jgi:hypothetical protein
MLLLVMYKCDVNKMPKFFFVPYMLYGQLEIDQCSFVEIICFKLTKFKILLPTMLQHALQAGMLLQLSQIQHLK